MPTFEAVGIVVSDMAASLAFYRLLGLEFSGGADTEAHVTAVATGGVDVMFDVEDVVKGFDTSWARKPGRGSVAKAFRCGDGAEVDATVAAIADAGHEVYLEPWDAFWGQRYAVVVDPDGTHVDVFADLE